MIFHTKAMPVISVHNSDHNISLSHEESSSSPSPSSPLLTPHELENLSYRSPRLLCTESVSLEPLSLASIDSSLPNTNDDTFSGSGGGLFTESSSSCGDLSTNEMGPIIAKEQYQTNGSATARLRRSKRIKASKAGPGGVGTLGHFPGEIRMQICAF